MDSLPSILTRTHRLDAGPPVRLRLARRSDEAAVTELLEARGLAPNALDMRRLLAFDPSRRTVLCATAPVDGHETVVGVGAIDLEAGADVDTLVADESLNPGLGKLLRTVLRAHAETRARRVA